MAKNPIVQEDSASEVRERFRSLPPEAREALYSFCRWLAGHAREKAERSWQSSKGPMALYWKTVAAWAYHIRRFIAGMEQSESLFERKEDAA